MVGLVLGMYVLSHFHNNIQCVVVVVAEKRTVLFISDSLMLGNGQT